jgi:hypothetical protein
MTTATTSEVHHDDSWEMEVPSKGGGDYVCCPPGNYPATIVGLFDVGHQADQNLKGESIEQRKLIVVFEFTKKRPDGKPFILGREYTWSMSEKAHFHQTVTNLTGRKFKEGDRFNPLSLCGAAVMVTVTNSGNGEKVYHNISSVSQFPEGFPVPEPDHTPLAWSVRKGDPFPVDTDWLPFIFGRSIKDIAEDSREARNQNTPKPSTTPPDDDIPY